MRDFHRRILRAAQALGIEGAHIEHRGEPHPRLVATFAGRSFRYPIAAFEIASPQTVKSLAGDARPDGPVVLSPEMERALYVAPDWHQWGG